MTTEGARLGLPASSQDRPSGTWGEGAKPGAARPAATYRMVVGTDIVRKQTHVTAVVVRSLQEEHSAHFDLSNSNFW